MQEFCIEVALQTTRFNLKINNCPEAYDIAMSFYIIFFVCFRRVVCCKDRQLHFHMDDIRERNV